MLKKTIEYVDFNGEERTEDFWFHLSKAEILEWISSTDGSYTLDKYLVHVAKTKKPKEVMDTFKDLIWRSYGEKSLDGRRFMKSDEIKQNFFETEAYSILFTELVSDASKASEFINGIIPPDLAKEIQKIVSENPDGIPDEMKDYLLGENSK